MTKIQGFEQFFKNKKYNVFSIIFNVKISADSKKILILTKCKDFWPYGRSGLYEVVFQKYDLIYPTTIFFNYLGCK